MVYPAVAPAVAGRAGLLVIDSLIMVNKNPVQRRAWVK